MRPRKFPRVRATGATKSANNLSNVANVPKFRIEGACMKYRITTIALTAAALLMFACPPSLAFTSQTNTNKNSSVKGEMKQSGKEVKQAGKSLGTNVKKGRVVRGGKYFGKHMYRAGKHFGKGTGKAAKKTGSAVKKAAKP